MIFGKYLDKEPLVLLLAEPPNMDEDMCGRCNFQFFPYPFTILRIELIPFHIHAIGNQLEGMPFAEHVESCRL